MIREMRGRGIKGATRVGLQDCVWSEFWNGGIGDDVGVDDGVDVKVSGTGGDTGHF